MEKTLSRDLEDCELDLEMFAGRIEAQAFAIMVQRLALAVARILFVGAERYHCMDQLRPEAIVVYKCERFENLASSRHKRDLRSRKCTHDKGALHDDDSHHVAAASRRRQRFGRHVQGRRRRPLDNSKSVEGARKNPPPVRAQGVVSGGANIGIKQMDSSSER